MFILNQEPEDRPFAWLRTILSRIETKLRDESLPAKELAPLRQAAQIVAVASDLLTQTKGFNFVESDLHELGLALATKFEKLGSERGGEQAASVAATWRALASVCKPGFMIVDGSGEQNFKRHVNFLSTFANMLLLLVMVGKVQRELVPMFIGMASGMTANLSVLSQ